MARFYGPVGFGEQVKTSPGVFEDVVTEKNYFGDILLNIKRHGSEEKVNSDFTVGNSISIVADPYAHEHFHAILYVRWSGALWTVESVEVRSPRLVLRLGGVYNGATP